MAASFIRRFLFDPGAAILLEIESVNVLDLEPPASITGVGSGTVLLTAELEDGPFAASASADGLTPPEILEVSSATDFQATYGGFGYTYGGVGAQNPCARVRFADGAIAPDFWNGNGAVALNGKRYARLIVARVDTSVGAVQFTRDAFLTGAANFAYPLQPGQNLVINDGTSATDLTATFLATPATTTFGAFVGALAAGDKITFQVDANAAFSVVFLATDTTIDLAISRINQYAGFTFATKVAGVIVLTGLVKGLLGQIVIVSESPAGVGAKLGYAGAFPSTFNGTGNVANIAAVKATEVDAVVFAAAPNVHVQVDPGGALRLVLTGTPGAGDLRVVSATATALGFPVEVSSSPITSNAVMCSIAGTYPTGFVGGETITVGADGFPNVVVTFAVGDQTLAQVIAKINLAVKNSGQYPVGYIPADTPAANILRLTGARPLGQFRVVAASAPGVLTTLGLAVETVTGSAVAQGTLPAGTRVTDGLGQHYVTMQALQVLPPTATATNEGPYLVKVRHATDDGTGLVSGAGTITIVEAPIAIGAFNVINLLPTTAALSESAIDAKYTDALAATLDPSSIGHDVNISYSARQSNQVRRALRSNALDASANGLLGRMACIRPPLGTNKNLAKSTTVEPGVGAYRDQRVIYCFPAASTFFPPIALLGAAGGTGFNNTGIIDVGADGFMATVLSQLAPEENPGQQTPFLDAVVGLESSPNAKGYVMDDYVAFRASGIAALRIAAGTAIFQSGVTSVDPLVQPNLRNIARRRMADFIQDTLALRLASFGKKLSTIRRRSAITAEIRAFMTGLLSPNNPAAQRIGGFLLDAKSANTKQLLAAGRFRIILNVQTLASLDSIELQTEIGESVDVTELPIAA